MGSAAGACLLSLVCSTFDVGAIEMLVLQIMYNGLVFHFLWHGAASPSNALVHGDYRTGHQVSSCGFCGDKVLFFPNSHRYPAAPFPACRIETPRDGASRKTLDNDTAVRRLFRQGCGGGCCA